MTRAQVLAVAGTPLSVETHPLEESGPSDSSYTLAYPFGNVTLYGDRVEYVQCAAEECWTVEGIWVGSPLDSVIALYGPREPTMRDQSAFFIYHYRNTDCGLTVELARGRVVALGLWCDNS